MNLLGSTRFCSHNLVEMKKVFYLFGLMALPWEPVGAQDNRNVEGIVVEASNYQCAPADLEIEVGQTVVWVNMGGFHDVNGVTSSIMEEWDNPETFSLGAVNGT